LWIEEDLKTLLPSDGTQLPSISKITEDGEIEESHIIKKKKANSSKEGTLPAYVNVELIHPPKLSPDQMPPHMLKLSTCVVNGDIDWTNEDLEEHIMWFKQNRQKLMEAIPPVSLRNKRSTSSKKKPKSPETTIPPMEEVHEALDGFPFCVCNANWIHYDLLKSDDAYWLKVDLPGMIPSQDFSVQTDDINKLLVKGDRKLDLDLQDNQPTAEFLQQRTFGPFEMVAIFPLAVDLSKTEQNYQNGVLTVKCPMKDSQWRNLSGDMAGIEEKYHPTI